MSLLIIALTCIRFLTSLCHAAGFYLLYRSRNTTLCRSQRLYLMNFSVSEIMLCVFGVLKRICQLAGASEAQNYILILQWTGLSLGYYLAMILLTLDRFLKFILDIKYAAFWTERRTKQSIMFAWVLIPIFGILSLCLIPKDEFEIIRFTTLYFFSAFDITFVLIACLAYGSLFKTLRTVRRRSTTRLSFDSAHLPKMKKEKLSEKKRQNRDNRTLNVLFVPTWIIITYLAFIMLPDQLYFYCFILNKKLPHIWDVIISFAYCIGFISDAFIYIFLSPPVRKTLMHILRKRFSCIKRNRSYIQNRERILTMRHSRTPIPTPPEESVSILIPREQEELHQLLVYEQQQQEQDATSYEQERTLKSEPRDKEQTEGTNELSPCEEQAQGTPQLKSRDREQNQVTPKPISRVLENTQGTPKLKPCDQEQIQVTPKLKSRDHEQTQVIPKLKSRDHEQTQVTPELEPCDHERKQVTLILKSCEQDRIEGTPKLKSRDQEQKQETSKLKPFDQEQIQETPKLKSRDQQLTQVTSKLKSRDQGQTQGSPKLKPCESEKIQVTNTNTREITPQTPILLLHDPEKIRLTPELISHDKIEPNGTLILIT